MKKIFFTIKQVAMRTNLTIPTLRYYDKLGLMPQLNRNASGTRQFTEEDICWIELICCLKNSGMPLQEIKKFMQLCLKKDAYEERKEMLKKHRNFILEQIKQLECSLCTIDYKLEHYKEVGVFPFIATESTEKRKF